MHTVSICGTVQSRMTRFASFFNSLNLYGIPCTWTNEPLQCRTRANPFADVPG